MASKDTYLKIARSYFSRGVEAAKDDLRLVRNTCPVYDGPFVFDEAGIVERYVKYIAYCQTVGVFPVFYTQNKLWYERLKNFQDFAGRFGKVILKARPADFAAFFKTIEKENTQINFSNHVDKVCSLQGGSLLEAIDYNKNCIELKKDYHIVVFYASFARCMTPTFNACVWPSLKKHPLKIDTMNIHLNTDKMKKAESILSAITSACRIASSTDEKYQVFAAQWVLSLATWFGIDSQKFVTSIGLDKSGTHKGNFVFYDWTELNVIFDDNLDLDYQHKGSLKTYSFLMLIIALAQEVISGAGKHMDHFISPWDMRLEKILMPPGFGSKALDRLKQLVYSFDFVWEPGESKPKKEFVELRYQQSKSFVENILEKFYPTSCGDIISWGSIDDHGFIRKVIRDEILGAFMNPGEIHANDFAQKLAFMARYLYVCEECKLPPLLMYASDAQNLYSEQ